MLHLAVGDIECVKFLLSEGADVHAKNDRGETPLHVAAVRPGNAEVRTTISLLFSKGADANAKDNEGNTPLLRTSKSGFYGQQGVSVARELIYCGADVNAKDKDGLTPLFWTVSRMDMEVTKLLIDNDADVNVTNKNGNTLLSLAMASGRSPLIRYLLSVGAGDTEQGYRSRDNFNRTPLHLMVDDINAVKRLVAAGADIHATDNAGRTPLHAAVSWADERMMSISRMSTNADYLMNIEVILFLIGEGADVNAKDKGGKTPLDMMHPAVRGCLESAKKIQ